MMAYPNTEKLLSNKKNQTVDTYNNKILKLLCWGKKKSQTKNKRKKEVQYDSICMKIQTEDANYSDSKSDQQLSGEQDDEGCQAGTDGWITMGSENFEG